MGNPCKVCGGTDMNLVDGYYYCVECGTQDANVRETIVEMTVLADGTIAISDRRKLTTKLKAGIRMSGEWYKWHAYNFILSSLTEEMISLGAAPTLRSKVLWIWTRYIKKFQNKKELGDSSKLEDKTLLDNKELDLESDDEDGTNTDPNAKFTKRKLLTIIYIALNLDHSDIQLSHLLRFIKEGRLSFDISRKFIPAEIKRKFIPKLKVFQGGDFQKSHVNIRGYAMSFFKCLDLGVPLVPNLTKLVDQYMKELCLPLDFRDFLLALIHLVPCDFLYIDEMSMEYLVRLPNYELNIMSYVLLAMKICFGLDDDYEERLSDAVDTVNFNQDHSKSYNLGFQPEPSNRLFSFRDWYNYLHIRRVMLSKYYIHVAQTYGLPFDDYVLLEQLPKPLPKQPTFSDHVTMDILNKIHNYDIPQVIPNEQFPPSLTPITTYLDVVSSYIQDPDIKLILCENFSQYSLKYITRDLKLPDSDFKLKGVSKTNKTINDNVEGVLAPREYGKHLVYVRNCENHNWLKTKQPSADHININKPCATGGAEDGDEYNLNNEKNNLAGNAEINLPPNEKIEEESAELNIFDDEFECNTNEIKTVINNTDLEADEMRPSNDYYLSEEEDDVTLPVGGIDRNQIIQELIEIASKKYKIPLPKENRKSEPRKRKIFATIENSREKLPKKTRIESQDSRQPINDIISAYYDSLHSDVLNRTSETVKNVVEEVADQITTPNDPEESVSEENNNGLGVISETKSIAEDNISNSLCIINETMETNENEVNKHEDNVVQENGEVDDPDLSDNDADLIPAINPDFDANTHNTDQLYVKAEHLDIKAFDVWDEKLETIIEKNIIEKDEDSPEVKTNENISDAGDTSDSEDDLPLIVYKHEKQFEENREKFTNIEFTALLGDRNVNKYKFWIRHYKSMYFHKKLDRAQTRFEAELKKYPKSFVFLLKECSSLVECSPFSLYRNLQNLEQRFMNYNN